MSENHHWKGLNAGFSVRPASMDDVEMTTHLFNRCSLDMIGAEDFTTREVELDWQTPGFDLSKDSRVVFNPDGELVGFTSVWADSEIPVHPFVWGRVHPDHRDLGIGSEMLEWSFERARDAIHRVPQDARVAIIAYSVDTYEPSKRLLEDHGMKVIRHSWQMLIDLDAELPQPNWPDGISLADYDHEKHGEAVYLADYEAFKDHYGFIQESFEVGYPRWILQMIEDEGYDPALWFIAFDGDEIAGGSICRTKSWEDPDSGWIRSLFVRKPWRRRGLALALLRHSFHEFKKRGKLRAGLGVDSENLTGATRLYKKAGMRINRQYNRYELEVRPGIDLSNNGNSS